MRIEITKPLFAWECLEDSPCLKSVKLFLDAIPDGPLLVGVWGLPARGKRDTTHGARCNPPSTKTPSSADLRPVHSPNRTSPGLRTEQKRLSRSFSLRQLNHAVAAVLRVRNRSLYGLSHVPRVFGTFLGRMRCA